MAAEIPFGLGVCDVCGKNTFVYELLGNNFCPACEEHMIDEDGQLLMGFMCEEEEEYV